MTKNHPNLFQKLVRGVIRDLINQTNSHTDKPIKSKAKRTTPIKSQSQSKPNKKRDRVIFPQKSGF